MKLKSKIITALVALTTVVLFAPTSHAATPPKATGGPWTWVNEASGWCLDQDYTNGVPHNNALAWGCHGGDNQLWYVDGQSDGTNVLRNKASGWCLDQDYTDGVPHNSALVWGCHGGDNQRWLILFNGDGSYTFMNKASGWCLDQDYTNGVPHNGVLVWGCHGGANQRWR